MAEPTPPHPGFGVERTDKLVEQLFPDRGPRPPDMVIPDPDAEPTPNIGHPQ